MSCECSAPTATTDKQRQILRVALFLNAAMFIIGMTAGWWAQSTALMADALDMLADASAYGLGLMAITRGDVFRRNSARWSGALLLILGIGILAEVGHRTIAGSEPQPAIMMAFSLLSLVVNVTVLRMLAPFRTGEVHLRATWIFTRTDVIANVGVLVAGVVIFFTGWTVFDLVAGFLIGSYVIKEAAEILKESSAAPASA
jgi:Co/Zn/Cd efflux system component